MLENKFHYSVKGISRKLYFAYVAIASMSVAFLLCMLTTGCKADPISQVKNGVLQYDTSTTFGQAVKGMMNKKNVQWEKIKDTSGRTFVKCRISLADADGFFYPTSYLDYEIDPAVRFAKMDNLVYTCYKDAMWNFMALGRRSGFLTDDQTLADMFVKYESMYDVPDGGTNDSGERFFVYGDTTVIGNFLFDVNGDFSLNDCSFVSSISAPSMEKMTVMNSYLDTNDFLQIVYNNKNFIELAIQKIQ